MASLSAVFSEKERTNWLKAWLAVDIAKAGLEQFVENEAITLQASIYKLVLSSSQAQAACIGCHTANLLKCPTKNVCNKRGSHSTCTSMHDSALKQPRPCPANVCNKVHDEIVKQHRFNNPSWKNTTAQQWATNPWQVGKAYLPPDGYAGKTSVQDTDFNGIISFMMNCKHFDNSLSFLISPGHHHSPCLLTKARDIGRTVRHLSQCKVTDPDLQDIFKTLTCLLSDPTCLVHDVAAKEAVRKLAELEQDTLKITTEEMIRLLEAAQDTLKTVENIADKSMSEMQMHLEQCKKALNTHLDKCKQELDEHTAKCNIAEKKDLNTHLDKCKQELDEHTEKCNIAEKKDLNAHTDKCKLELDEHTAQCTHAIDEHVSKTVESTYGQSCKELIERTKKLYSDTLSRVTISPLNDYIQEKVGDVYLSPKIVQMSQDRGTFKKTDSQVTQYKDVLFTDDTVNPRIFLQGEAGSGKTTFLAKMALDWCGEPHVCSASDNRSIFFSDVDVLQGFVFVFHITLRNSVKQFDVYTLIKEQIIDSIYSYEDRAKAYILLNEIMKREQCLVLLDGLDEWTGPGDHHNIPTLVVDHSKCVMLFSTRPWKLAVSKIMLSDMYTSVQLEGINKPFELSRILLSRLVDKDDLKIKYSAFKNYIAKQKLYNLLLSPMMLSAIVCSYAEGTELKGSKCEIYILLLESLFKKPNSEMCTFEQPPFRCFTGTQYIQPNMESLNRLAELAFHLLFVNARENSLVFTDTELRKFKLNEREQKEFALKSGILSSARNTSSLRSASSFSFIHLSMQEFLAAYHIARNTHLVDGVISVYLKRHNDAYREISQVFIFLCGLDVSSVDSLSSMMEQHHVMPNSNYDVWLRNYRFQDTILTGLREAVANGHNDIRLRLSRFSFDNDNIIDLHRIWTNNASNVLSLEVDKYQNDESASHITLDISLCRKLQKLHLQGGGILLKDFSDVASLELPVWIVLNSSDPSQYTDPSPLLPSIEYIVLRCVTCSYTSLCSLLSSLLTLDHKVKCVLNYCEITSCVEGAVCKLCKTGRVKIKKENKQIAVTLLDTSLLIALNGLNITSLSTDGRCKAFRENHKESLTQTIVLLLQLDELSIKVKHSIPQSPDQWKTLHGLNIRSLSLRSWELKHTESLSQSLASLTRLEMLSIEVHDDAPGMWEALHGLSIKSLSLSIFWILQHTESLSQSLASLTRLEMLSIEVDYDAPGLCEALHGLSVKSLSLSLGLSLSLSLSDVCLDFEIEYATSLKQSLLSIKQLETISISVGVYSPCLWKALNGLSIKNLSLSMRLSDVCLDFELEYATSLKQSLLSLKQLETLSLSVNVDSPGLWEALSGLNINRLSLSGVRRGLRLSVCSKWGGLIVEHAESLSQSLSSLTELETLTLYVHKYIALQVPRSLKYLNIYFTTLLPSELRDLVDTLAACSHAIEINLECAFLDNQKRIPLQKYIPIEQELVSRTNVVVKRFQIYVTESYSTMPVLYIGGVDDPAHRGLSMKHDAYERFAKLMKRFKCSRISIGLQINPDSFL
ncbi:uncharacterized protein LOC127851293 isoform X2 [Dreissena polymorpha]|nr:uncharacterized protein LOC127851293 isoform X2 [Dreissena polymorpha]XP_052240954.1 uncharacterized protein LOC127851293 isoform X2 [Dreissena polymorpha]